jgi:hypothetical protein
MAVPLTRYTKTADGVHVAYQVCGSGPHDLPLANSAYSSNMESAASGPCGHPRRASSATTRSSTPCHGLAYGEPRAAVTCRRALVALCSAWSFAVTPCYPHTTKWI